ncbi:CYTH domain-containing protein [Aromatoleum evansii]|uniref:CYTH domain-containing protein n=1 Tax=Aromatoleum evansii TaxID=59406 RepID=UPI00145F1A22|nr:CYTH domain-containing protein [Aromatoleum evansii]NMG28178.1 CYTH domain-containing protein [Aromatoleum evansii]
MGQEIERRFLVRDPQILDGRVGKRIVQGYVAKESGAMTTRVRIHGDRSYLTLKGPRQGFVRDEFEYPIPTDDAWHILLEHCGNRIIQKTRYLIEYLDHLFEVDVFEGRHTGLVIAELELSHVGQKIALPSWIGEEITGDKRFGNFFLALFEGPVRPEDKPVGPSPAVCSHCLTMH